MWVPVLIPAAPHPFQLPACGLGKQLRMAQSLGTLHPHGDLDEAPGPWFQISSAPNIVAAWGVNHQMEDLPLCLSSSLYIRLSNKNKINLKIKSTRAQGLGPSSAACFSLAFFLKDFYHLFLLQRQIYREEERQRGRSSVQWFTPQVTTMADAAPIQSQEFPLGLPHGCRVPRFWTILNCFPRPQAGSWMGNGVAKIGTGAHMAFRCMTGKHFSW